MTTARKASAEHGVVGYLRVSTEDQAVSGAGLAAQEAAIRAECQRRGLPLLAMHTDAGVSGKSLVRPALTAALEDLEAGHGDVLMVAKLDRLTRSVHDASGLMMLSEKGGWGLVALDAPVDTTTPAGRAMAQILSVFAELERRLIGERTKAALAVKREQGVVLGRPKVLPERDSGAHCPRAWRGQNVDGHRGWLELRRGSHCPRGLALVCRDRAFRLDVGISEACQDALGVGQDGPQGRGNGLANERGAGRPGISQPL